LGLSDDEIIRNYFEAGHVCGDSLDVIQGKPTGAVRASFGKDSIWEDLDVLVEFLQHMFVDRSCPTSSVSSSDALVGNHHHLPTQAVISELFLFPIKSCAAQHVPAWPLDRRTGRFLLDREFALVDSSGTAMRLQSYPCMTQLRPTVNIETRVMTVSAPGQVDLSIDLARDLKALPCPHNIQVCGNRCGAVLWDDGIVSDWFSSFIGVKCWLARFAADETMMKMTMTGDCNEQSIGKRSRKNVAFANERPLLLLSERSIELLNAVLQSQGQSLVSCRQFRPNIVVVHSSPAATVSGMEENPEDDWTRVALTSTDDNPVLAFEVVDKCARCAMVDFDPTTGGKSKVFQSLAKFRRSRGQITFGVFLECSNKEQKSDVDAPSIHVLRKGDVLSCT
jgi:molybdenum cofactor sulfurtransferase